ncbi:MULTISPECIES: helix-turn-helix domain-containing protein [Heyndrickxia]|nr:helix-turn-helix transcriptional regulator [Heyndrickxia shackletonii]MBB2482344.1 helix-turn-helix transcriptional regulator [Bacillus sp. APMAM]NEZ02125.1 helix-turn-helix transcriptional regulator [Heyndrickxia shackletonii]RTZ54269.1 XRE family transcriptional regulator [Bacillus sp. SAJ1]
MSTNTLSNWSTGKKYPSVDKAFEFANLIAVKVDEQYEWVEDEKI